MSKGLDGWLRHPKRLDKRAIILLVALLLGGCDLPTGPDKAPLTAKELYAVERVDTFSEALGIPFEVYTYFYSRKKNGAVAWAEPDAVVFYRGWVNEQELIDISWVAAHEVCHISGTGSEPATIECQRRLHEDAR